MKKKLLALLLAIVLVVGIIPVAAVATTDEVTAPTVACLPGNGFEVDCTHIWTAKYGEIAPTCEVGGWAFWYCGNCGIWLTWWPLCPTGHTEVIDAAVAPTCTETGLTEGSHCAVCEKILVAQEVVDALGHNMDGADHKEPTCTEDGYKAHKCTRCGYREEYTVDKLGHVAKEYEGKAPTCTEAGATAHPECERCGAVLAEKDEIPALGHDVIKFEGKAATCTEPGVTAHTECKRCGVVLDEKEEIPALGHDVIKFDGKAPTCTEPGVTAHTECQRCGIVLTEKEEIPATDHNWDDGVITREPTPEKVGEKTYTCKNNSEHKKYEDVAYVAPEVEETPKEEAPKVEQEATPDKNLDEVPKTGDNSGLILATMSGVAMLSAAAYVFGKKRSVR